MCNLLFNSLRLFTVCHIYLPHYVKLATFSLSQTSEFTFKKDQIFSERIFFLFVVLETCELGHHTLLAE